MDTPLFVTPEQKSSVSGDGNLPSPFLFVHFAFTIG